MSSTRPDFIEELRAEARQTTMKQAKQNAFRNALLNNPDNELFFIKPADQWLKEDYSAREARQLLGPLWYENELCVMFADTNLGKSILAVQIGYCLAKNDFIHPFGGQMDIPVRVLYIDFELSRSQFKARYYHRDHGVHHFGDNFFRAEFNPAGDDPMLYDDHAEYVQQKITQAIRAIKPVVLIVDNITCMGSATGHAGGALPLMKALKAIKARYKLSILVLAHTPKRNKYSPLTENDLQGSKMIINFADSAFAIGQSQTDPELRYIKQIKQRNTASHFGARHICLFRISRSLSFLKFEFEDYDDEYNHLQKIGLIPTSTETKLRIAELNRQGLSLRQIADHLKIGSSTVRRVLMKGEG